MKRVFTVEDVRRNQRFSALTQGEDASIILLIKSCNDEQQILKGYITARRELLHNHFDREALVEYINLVPHYEDSNKVFQGIMHTLIEKVSRDFIRPSMVIDFVKATGIKLDHFNGDVEKVADCVEAYFTGEKIQAMADTWRERTEEVEKGMVIYYEPKSLRAV